MTWLHGKPRLIMPSDQHDEFTSNYVRDFERNWAKNRWEASSATYKMHLLNGTSRDPDLSYWARCRRNAKGLLVPTWRGAVPNAIIQFSWQNKAQYEEDTSNDMMNEGLEQDHGVVS